MTSPGTRSLAGGVTHFPSRLTRVLMASLALRASMALPACRSSQNPIMAFAKSRTRMMKKSGQCCTTPDSTTATSIIQGIGPQKYLRNLSSALVFFSSISFAPYFASRFVASAWVSPSGDALKRFSTSGNGRVFRSSLASEAEAGFASGDLAWAASGFAMSAVPLGSSWTCAPASNDGPGPGKVGR